MRRKILLRVFALLLLAVLLVFGAGLWAVHLNSRQILSERLTAEAELLSCMIATEADIAQLEAYENRDDFRITVIREDGTVLYESSISGELENHADREEVIGALSGTPHSVERYSETFGCTMTYYAVRSELENGDIVVLRLAVRSSEIASYLRVAVPFLLLVLALSLIISGYLAGRLSHSLAGRIGAVADSLKSLNQGEYKPIETDSREAEFYAIFREINELSGKTHQHIRTAEQEKERLNTVLDNVSQGIIALDASGNIAFANNSALHLFGGERQDVGKELIYLIEDSALCHTVTEHLGEGGVFSCPYAGRELSVAVRGIPEDMRLAAISSIIIVTDITREKEIVKEKSDFFANASHELKTPITVMQGMTELMLAKDTLDDASRRQVERIHKESLRMADLIADMLKLSRLEQREEEEPRIRVDMRAVAEEVIAELEPQIRAKNITVSVSGSGCVQADLKKINELIGNLCSNAVNYNKENGSICIDIFQNGAKSVLTVADTGIGIEKEHLPRLCERFYRVDKSRSKKTGGTGLGLAIVKHICVLYGAELSIESEIDVGTTVTVSFGA